MAMEAPLALLACLLALCPLALPHNDDAPPSHCQRDGSPRLKAAFLPGLITVDGNSSDWKLADGLTFVPLQAIAPDPDQPYPAGQLSIKVAHDGHDVFFLLEVPGPYEYSQGENKKCPSMALMFGVGDDATYYNMGGCHESPDMCSSTTCNGHEVDIMHFSIGNAVPGRQYGSNLFDNANSTGRDSFGNLNDLYGWNPHCRYLDGLFPNGSSIPSSGAQNDWRGAWSHSSMDLSYGLVPSESPYSTSGSMGTYTFEFARPLRTSDRLQQDVQFTIGGTHRFIVAFWYPVNNVPWQNSQHYSASCDWLPLDILPATAYGVTLNANSESHKISGIMNAFTLLLSIAALATSIAVCWWARSKRDLRFQSIDGL